jgi:chorismate mutase
LNVEDTPWVVYRSMAFTVETAPKKAVGRSRFTAFLLALAAGGDVMGHSVLEQAIQDLQASDEWIVQLLRLRSQLASRLTQAATASGHAEPVDLEARVSTVVSRLIRRNPGPLDNQRLASIFETVIRVTEPLSISLSPRNGAAKKG